MNRQSKGGSDGEHDEWAAAFPTEGLDLCMKKDAVEDFFICF